MTRMEMKLPVFLTRKSVNFFSLVISVLGLFIYLFTNHFHFSAPVLLPFTWVDSTIPFIPDSLWMYLSLYPMIGAAYFLARDLENLNKFLYSSFFVIILSVSFFLIWPTIYPRNLFQIPSGINEWTKFTFFYLRQIDTPASCCPSLHVSCSFLSSFIFLEEQKEKFPFFFLWSILISLSTLTTKQHYFIDVLTGFMISIFVYVVFYRFISYRIFGVSRAISD